MENSELRQISKGIRWFRTFPKEDKSIQYVVFINTKHGIVTLEKKNNEKGWFHIIRVFPISSMDEEYIKSTLKICRNYSDAENQLLWVEAPPWYWRRFSWTHGAPYHGELKRTRVSEVLELYTIRQLYDYND